MVDLKSIIEKEFSFIDFDPGKHLYTYQGSRFKSATKVKSDYLPKTDFNQIAMAIHRRTNKPLIEIHGEWKYSADWGKSRGTAVHQYIENDLTGVLEDIQLDDFVFDLSFEDRDKYMKELMKLVEQYKQFRIDFPHLTPVLSEVMVACKSALIAGTFDQIFYNEIEKRYEIWDWKTDKKYKDGYRKKLQYPFNNYVADTWHTYAVQLNIYRYIIKTITKIDIPTMKILWVCPFNDEYKVIDMIDLQNETKIVFDEYINRNITA